MGDRTAFNLEDEESTAGTEHEEIALTLGTAIVAVGKPPANDPVVGQFRQELGHLHLGAVTAFGRPVADPESHGVGVGGFGRGL